MGACILFTVQERKARLFESDLVGRQLEERRRTIGSSEKINQYEFHYLDISMSCFRVAASLFLHDFHETCSNTTIVFINTGSRR